MCGVSILSYLLVFFSDPGRLYEEFKTGLTEDQIKSIEEVIKNIK